MSLTKKKELAKRTFGVGKDKIIFVKSRLDDIKEAITKQYMRDLRADGAIIIKEPYGRKRVKKRKSKGIGKIRKITKNRKRDYVVLTRKLRKYINEMKKLGKLSRDDLSNLRKKIRNRAFKSKSHLKEYLTELKKEKQEIKNENPKKKKEAK